MTNYRKLAGFGANLDLRTSRTNPMTTLIPGDGVGRRGPVRIHSTRSGGRPCPVPSGSAADAPWAVADTVSPASSSSQPSICFYTYLHSYGKLTSVCFSRKRAPEAEGFMIAGFVDSCVRRWTSALLLPGTSGAHARGCRRRHGNWREARVRLRSDFAGGGGVSVVCNPGPLSVHAGCRCGSFSHDLRVDRSVLSPLGRLSLYAVTLYCGWMPSFSIPLPYTITLYRCFVRDYEP